MYSLFLHTPHANEPPIFEASVYICMYIVSYALPAIVGYAQSCSIASTYVPPVLDQNKHIFVCRGKVL